MRVEPLGDRALILRDLPHPAYQVAEAIRRAKVPGVEETNACYETVGVYLDGTPIDLSALELAARTVFSSPGREHRIPVRYELGDDLAEVAERLGLGITDLIETHSSGVYEVAAIGFCPGFPYLSGLPSRLQGLPRKGSPRLRVPVGSVAITGSQAGIYPMERPGGWWIVGRTPLVLVDVANGFFPIAAGDTLRFEPIDEAEFQRRSGQRL